jgi:hypothetical protein
MDGLRWHDVGYSPAAPDWQMAPPVQKLALPSNGDETWYLRQAFEAEEDAAALFLELLTEREIEVYLNGEPAYKLDALVERPQAWQSAGGTYSIDSPVLHLGLNQRLVRKGQNVLALRVRGQAPVGSRHREYIAYRQLERRQGSGPASNEEEAGQQ